MMNQIGIKILIFSFCSFIIPQIFLDYNPMEIDSMDILNIFDDDYQSHQLINYPLNPNPDSLSQELSMSFPKSAEKIEENYKSCQQTEKKRKKRKKKHKRKFSSDYQLNKGHWSNDENRMYHRFLQIHSQHFLTKTLRRLDKIFKQMSLFITTRKAEQCRSHHQKIEKKYHTFYQIITHLRMENYNSLSVKVVEEDLRSIGIIRHDYLISQQQLKSSKDKQSLVIEQDILEKDNLQKCEDINGRPFQQNQKTFAQLAED